MGMSSRIYFECCHGAVASFHLLRGRRGLARAFRAAAILPERGARTLLLLARIHADNPTFKRLCKNLNNRC
jgi:hypothetical protein